MKLAPGSSAALAGGGGFIERSERFVHGEEEPLDCMCVFVDEEGEAEVSTDVSERRPGEGLLLREGRVAPLAGLAVGSWSTGGAGVADSMVGMLVESGEHGAGGSKTVPAGCGPPWGLQAVCCGAFLLCGLTVMEAGPLCVGPSGVCAMLENEGCGL